jgi:hypothetical protein
VGGTTIGRGIGQGLVRFGASRGYSTVFRVGRFLSGVSREYNVVSTVEAGTELDVLDSFGKVKID